MKCRVSNTHRHLRVVDGGPSYPKALKAIMKTHINKVSTALLSLSTPQVSSAPATSKMMIHVSADPAIEHFFFLFCSLLVLLLVSLFSHTCCCSLFLYGRRCTRFLNRCQRRVDTITGKHSLDFRVMAVPSLKTSITSIPNSVHLTFVGVKDIPSPKDIPNHPSS